MNTQSARHEKSYRIPIYNTSDGDGSGVKALQIYAQAIDAVYLDGGGEVDYANGSWGINAPDFTKATLIGTIEDVDNTPSLAEDLTGNDPYTYRLRKANGFPIGSGEVPKHGAHNIYTFEFDNYVNGKYYHIWVLAVDKSGNLELLDDLNPNHSGDELQASDLPLYTTKSKLIDDIAPQFEGYEELGDLEYYNGNWWLAKPAYVGGDTTSVNTWFNNRYILTFNLLSVKYTRQIQALTYESTGNPPSGKKIKVVFEQTDNMGVNSFTNAKLLPYVAVNAAVGRMELQFANSNSYNLLGFLIERRVSNIGSEPSGFITDPAAGGAYSSNRLSLLQSNAFTDSGLILGRTNLTDFEDRRRYLYKITPISRYTTDGLPLKNDYSNAVKGEPTYSIDVISNMTSYYPASGNPPANINTANMSFVKANDGSISLVFPSTTDINDDIAGYEIQQQRLENTDAAWDLGTEVQSGWATVARSDWDSYDDAAGGKKQLKITGLQSYNAFGDGSLYVQYQFRIRAFDYLGNVSAWASWNSGNAIRIDDNLAPDETAFEVKANGKIGAWAVEVVQNYTNANDAVEEFEIFRKRVGSGGATIDDYKSVGRVSTVKRDLDGGNFQAVATFLDSEPPSNVVWYGVFKVKGRDRNNNWSDFSAESFTVASRTPELAGDTYAPKAPTGVTVSFDEENSEVTVAWTKPTEESIIDSIDITSVDSLTVSFDPLSLDDDELVGRQVRVVSGTGADTTGTITANTNVSITVDAWSATAPDGTSFIEVFSPLTDLDGHVVYKRRQGELAWVLVTDTNSSVVESVIDRALVLGDWEYAVLAYDLSGNESPLSTIDANAQITIEDTTAPPISEIQGVIGGIGRLQFVWDRTADDTKEYYISVKDSENKSVINADGDFVPSGRSATLTEYRVSGEQFILFGVTDLKNDDDGALHNISRYSVKIISVDKYDNSNSATAVWVPLVELASGGSGSAFAADGSPNRTNTDAIIRAHLENFVPASGVNATTVSASAVTDGDGNIEITISSPIDPIVKEVKIERASKANQGSYSAYGYLTTLNIPVESLSTGYFFEDLNLDRKTYKYRLTTISYDGVESSSSIELLDINAVDFTGINISGLDENVVLNKGSVLLEFKDVVDANEAKYEIWRTPYNEYATDVEWNTANFFNGYTSGDYPVKKVSDYWEKIAVLNSTRSNDIDTDLIRFQDNDWTVNGLIPDDETELETRIAGFIGYDGRARYAVVAIDRWGNRGLPYYIKGSGDAGYLSIPSEPHIAEVKKGAAFFDFNKGVQSTIGHTPKEAPEARLYKGDGVQVTGSLKYNIPHLYSNYSVVLRRSEKQLTDLSLSNAVDLLLYDTSKDSANYSQIDFPQIVLIIATATEVKVYDYNTMTLIDTYTPTLGDGVVNKIFFFEGKLYVGTTSTTYTQNYIKDYINNNISQLHNYTVNVNDVYVNRYLNVAYEIICTNSELTIFNGVNTIKSLSKGVFKKAVIRKGYLYAYKDGVIYKSKTTLNLLDFSVNGAEVSIFEIFMSLENNFENMNESSNMLLIAENKLLTIIDNTERTIKIGKGLNTLVPFAGSGLLCGVFEQLIDLLLTTEDNKILLTEDNKEIII